MHRSHISFYYSGQHLCSWLSTKFCHIIFYFHDLSEYIRSIIEPIMYTGDWGWRINVFIIIIIIFICEPSSQHRLTQIYEPSFLNWLRSVSHSILADSDLWAFLSKLTLICELSSMWTDSDMWAILSERTQILSRMTQICEPSFLDWLRSVSHPP